MHLDTSPRPPSFGHAAGIGTGTEKGSVEKKHVTPQRQTSRSLEEAATFSEAFPTKSRTFYVSFLFLTFSRFNGPTSASKTLASGVNRVYINHFIDFQRFPCSTAI